MGRVATPEADPCSTRIVELRLPSGTRYPNENNTVTEILQITYLVDKIKTRRQKLLHRMKRFEHNTNDTDIE